MNIIKCLPYVAKTTAAVLSDQLARKDSDYDLLGIAKRTNIFMIPGDIKLTCRDIRRLTGLTPSFQMARVAHAGGGVNRMSHTNSHDALDHNLKQGFSHFELDFSFTEDGKLVCIHDYEENFEAIFGFQTEEKPTLDAFKSLVEKASGFKNCTLESLTVWMEQNPSVFIITDIKEDNLKALRMISEKAPDFKRRIIPQIYDPYNYNLSLIHI